MRYKIICKCNGVNTIRSDERLHNSFAVFAAGPKDIDYDSDSERQYNSTIEGYFCEKCFKSFSYSEVLSMIKEDKE
jgi:hypothetical protein|tara:strand:+ start:3515 stop:3742 length:228 start_codon:yes stop_codon:yes gene_type:complete